MTPPFQITATILALAAEISRLLGKLEGMNATIPQPRLRRQNRIRTIKDSLAIEGNTLDLQQVSAVFDNKRVIGPQKDIVEVRNAVELYDGMSTFNPTLIKDLLKAHKVLMRDLVRDAGRFRSGAVGILKNSKVSHIAPSAKMVPQLMDGLFSFLKTDKNVPLLIKACVFHYEFEFIHPFSDGNGRLGRFWQSLILMKAHPVFGYLPVESLVKGRQGRYYQALERSGREVNSTVFIEFSLNTIRDALHELVDEVKPVVHTPASRLMLAKGELQNREFTRKDYMSFFKTISTATASRDLAWGVTSKQLKKTGSKAVTKYRFSH